MISNANLINYSRSGSQKTSIGGMRKEQTQLEYVRCLACRLPGSRTHVKRQQLAYIKQEYHIFSACFKASFPENSDGIASSLVYGDDFLHFYAFRLRDGKLRMAVHTYSRDGNTSFHPTLFDWTSSADPTMNDHLNVRIARVTIPIILILKLQKIERLLATDHYIKYGLED